MYEMFIITSGRKCSYLFHLNKKSSIFYVMLQINCSFYCLNDEYYSMQYFCVCERFVFICECFNHYNLLTVFWFWWWCFSWPILSFFFAWECLFSWYRGRICITTVSPLNDFIQYLLCGIIDNHMFDVRFHM